MDRVLLGAIFRKLPLKLLLVILAVVAVFFACTKAGFVDVQIYGGQDNFILKSNYGNPDILCFSNVNKCNNILYTLNYDGTYSNAGTFNQYYEVGDSGVLNYICNIEGLGFDVVPNNSTCTISVYYPDNYSSQQCQSEYNLIPINEVDSAYCESNNLCPSSSPSDCPNVGVSNLFINDVFHPGAFNIIMNIPEEIDWDYAYTNSGSNINIDVVGYNQDTEYINGLIDVNNYKPTSEDFTNIFGLFSNYGGLLIACLFVILVFYFIKKAFK